MKIFGDFRKFVLRGNIMDLAIGFTVGAAFTTVVKSMVGNLIMPPLGLVLGDVDFTNRFLVLREGESVSSPYKTLAEAQSAGAVTWNYGAFVNDAFSLLLIALAMFFILRSVRRVEQKLESEFGQEKAAPSEPSTKVCMYCLTAIPYRATRCPACTSNLVPDRSKAGSDLFASPSKAE
ncbi:MAG: large conductance mechanosensitive channel protein MscL [Opitutales bacterium]